MLCSSCSWCVYIYIFNKHCSFSFSFFFFLKLFWRGCHIQVLPLEVYNVKELHFFFFLYRKLHFFKKTQNLSQTILIFKILCVAYFLLNNSIYLRRTFSHNRAFKNAFMILKQMHIEAFHIIEQWTYSPLIKIQLI